MTTPRYPPSAPLPASPNSATWLPSLGALTARLSFAWRNAGTLALAALYLRDSLVSAALFNLPLVNFYNQLKRRLDSSSLGAFAPEGESTTAFLHLAPQLPIAVLEVPEIPTEIYYLIAFFDPFGECVSCVSTLQTGNTAKKLVLVGTRTLASNLVQSDDSEVIIIESPSDILKSFVTLTPRDPDDESAQAALEGIPPMRFLPLDKTNLKSVRLLGELEARVGSWTKDAPRGDGVLFDSKDALVGPSKEWNENKIADWDIAARIMYHSRIPGTQADEIIDSPLHSFLLDLSDLGLLFDPTTVSSPTLIPSTSKKASLRFDPGEEKKTVRLLDASYKAGELLEWYSTLRSDPLISPVLRNGTWTRLAPHTGLDATTWDLLERAFRREAVYPDPELQLWTTQTDSTGAKLEAGNAYRVVLTEPRVREGGLWTLSLRTGDNEIVDMITSSTVKKDFTDGMIKISVGRGADAVNLLETPDAGDLVLVLEIFGADGGFEGTVDKL